MLGIESIFNLNPLDEHCVCNFQSRLFSEYDGGPVATSARNYLIVVFLWYSIFVTPYYIYLFLYCSILLSFLSFYPIIKTSKATFQVN